MFYENAFPSKSHESAKFWFEKKSRISRIIVRKNAFPRKQRYHRCTKPFKKKRQEASCEAPCHLLNRKKRI